MNIDAKVLSSVYISSVIILLKLSIFSYLVIQWGQTI
jgi:hypothetical protein